MNSKQRLLNCIEHKPIDRVPVSTYDLVGWDPDSWQSRDPSYSRLLSIIRDKLDCEYMLNPVFKNPFADNLTNETWIEENSTYTRSIYHSKEGPLTSLSRRDDGIHTIWHIEPLLKSTRDIDKYLKIPYEPSCPDMSKFLKVKTELAYKGLMMISIPDPVCVAAKLFGMSEFLILALCESELVKYLLDALHQRQMHELRQILIHDIKDVIIRICGPEYATEPYLNPSYFYNYVTCYLITMCKEIRLAGGIPRIHCHGKIASIISQFAMTDAVAIDPLEPPPDGDMYLSDVKRLYGEKFCLFGNIELKELETASEDRIDELVKKAIDDAGQNTGFVLTTTASPINSPLSEKTEKNYIRMIESALEYGQY